jgi:chlorite dismutase
MSAEESSRRPAAAQPTSAPAAQEAGWPVLHLFQSIDRARWLATSEADRARATEEFSALLDTLGREPGMQIIPSGVIGKADVAFMAVHPELRRVQQLTQQIAATHLGSCLSTVYSFLSISEKSEYISTTGDHAKKLLDDEGLTPDSPEFQRQVAGFAARMGAYADSRIHPQLPGPDMPVVCFYPMSKARGEGRNWYALPFNERKRLMGSHADAGRRYANRVSQLITSSTGLDDWEWGVTLFTRDLKSIRDIVYEMRYDEGSALYGQFGPFYVSVRFTPGELREALRL